MTFTTKLATGVGNALEHRFSRRSLLGRAAVVGAAVTVGGLDFVLRPTPAYAAVCGPGASCGDGWTAMCCTINAGVNQCPPGSFAGGWWKADGASLCGGQARYYIDCQGECTHCGCNGSPFCTDTCWNCERRCASGTCDERRVCWNVFRYGQCNQQVGCSGPVLCRMISCVPPWKFESCTTDAATDDNTTDHTAPCLSPWSPLQSSYASIGGAGSVLGAEVGAEYAVAGGTAQHTTAGRLYRSSAGADRWVLNAVLTTYVAHGEVDALGLPTTNTTKTADGHYAYNDFAENFSIYVGPSGSWLLGGPIRTLWVQLGRENAAVGYPSGPDAAVGAGNWQVFVHGVIASSTAGTLEILAPVAAGWLNAGAANVGYPTAAAAVNGGVTTQTCTAGLLCASSATGSHAVYGDIYAAWQADGGVSGSYGLPTADVAVNGGGGTYQTFQEGRIDAAPSRSHPQRHVVPPRR